jgi:hypothetical protein
LTSLDCEIGVLFSQLFPRDLFRNPRSVTLVARAVCEKVRVVDVYANQSSSFVDKISWRASKWNLRPAAALASRWLVPNQLQCGVKFRVWFSIPHTHTQIHSRGLSHRRHRCDAQCTGKCTQFWLCHRVTHWRRSRVQANVNNTHTFISFMFAMHAQP